MIQGSMVALVTPMHEDGSIDWATYRNLIDWHVEQGTNAIVAVGTTGESATVTLDEHAELIKVAVEHAAKRIPVIAGTGANSTVEAIELTRFAKLVGAEAGLSVTPYYNKPTQEGLFLHYKKIAEAVDLPLILYNVPGRTAVDMSNDTTLRLAALENIVGIKDATANIERGLALITQAPKGFAIYTGDDGTAMALMLLGAQGVISVTANVVPQAMSQLCQAAIAGELMQARAINARLINLHKQLFCEANPIPVKWALAQMGKMPKGIRLPLTPLSESAQPLLLEALKQAGAL